MGRRARSDAPRIELSAERVCFLSAACEVVKELLPSLKADVFEPLMQQAQQIHPRLGAQARKRFAHLRDLVGGYDEVRRPSAHAFDDIDWTAAKMLNPSHHMELWSGSRRRPDGSLLRPYADISSTASVENVFEVLLHQTSELASWLTRWRLPSEESGRWASDFFEQLLGLWAEQPASAGSLQPVAGTTDFMVGGFAFAPTIAEDAAGDVDEVMKRLEVEARTFFRRRYGSGINRRPLDHLEMASLAIIEGRKQDAIAEEYGVTVQAVSAAVARVRAELGVRTAETS